MNKLSWTLLAVILFAVPSTALADGEPTWLADYDAAVEVAKQEGKDLLVDFTGSDWCGWCKRLHAEVFEHEAFWRPVTEKYVLVALDFPRSEELKAKVPNPARNQELMRKYGIGAYPTILLLTADGEVLGRTGYEKGGPENYVKHLAEIRLEGEEAIRDVAELKRTYDDAEGEAKSAAFEQILEKLKGMEPGSPGMATLAKIVRAKLLDDTADETLRRKVLDVCLEKRMVDDEVARIGKALDPKNEAGLYERIVSAELLQVTEESQIPNALHVVEAFDALGVWKDKKLAVQIYATGAFWNYRFIKDTASAKKYAKKLKETEPNPNPKLKGLLDMILGSE